MLSTREIGALEPIKLSYTVDSCSSVSGSFVPNNVLVDRPLEASSRWAGVYHPYPNPSATSASLSKPASIDPIHTAGSTFNPALRYGAGTAEGTLVGERAAGASPTAGVGITEGRNWLMLRLDRPAVLRTITFGKLHRPHPCTMKNFVVYAGMDKNNLKEILHASLKHDGVGETFNVGWREAGEADLPVTTRFIKIVPLSAQGANYNTSIWYVAFGGVSDESVVQGVFDQYNKARDGRMFRLMLKHLRQNRLFAPFDALLQSSPSAVTLEHPLLSELHTALVQRGDFSTAEKLISTISADGLFDAHLRSQPARAAWTRLDSYPSPDASSSDGRSQPGRRAGHRMLADEGSDSRPARLYLFGGWNGQHNLDDMWVFEDGSWREIKRKLSRDGSGDQLWPSPRSCHGLVLEPLSGDIYMTGRYIEEDPVTSALNPIDGDRDSPHASQTAAAGTNGTSQAEASAARAPNEFWRFSIAEGEKWELLSSNTEVEGGPVLIYDHEMIVDAERQTIYCFGGSDGSPFGPYSGLYRYEIRERKWACLVQDKARGLISRSGHCMLWNPKKRIIYIFGGLRSDRYLSDLWEFRPDLGLHDDDALRSVPDFFVPGGPEAAFTQRAALDVARDQIVFMPGLRKAPGAEEATTKRGVWVFDLESRRWSKLLGKGEKEAGEGEDGLGVDVKVEEDVEMDDDEELGDVWETEEPAARYAYQFAFDAWADSFYLFGGNDGREDAIRLSDFWRLKIERPLKAEIERKCLVACRKQKFIEMSEGGPAIEALGYLQTQLSSVIQHDDPAESEMFVALTGHLLSRPLGAVDMAVVPPGSPPRPPSDDVYHKRTVVFNTIQSFISDPTQKEPEGDLAVMVDARLGPLRV